jgi:hypothetical protein
MNRTRTSIVAVAAIASCVVVGALASSKEFLPDFMFKGSALTGWNPVGAADWRAENGEIVGTAKAGGSGGWLILDKSLQDVQAFVSFRCTGECKAGLLFRAEKTADGMKGVYVSLAADDLASYRVTLNSEGKELTREKLPTAGGNTRFASVIPEAVGATAPAAGAARGGGGGGGRGRAGAAGLRADWNDVDVILDTDFLRVSLNGAAGIQGGDAADAAKGYGPFALHISAGEVRFKDVSYKDLRVKGLPVEQVSSRFKVQRVNPLSYTYSAEVADINRDGTPDIVAGPFYYLGPDYSAQREMYLPQSLNPGTVAAVHSRIQIAYDFTGDGWPDVVRVYPNGARLYVNPKTESRRWETFDVLTVSTEIALFRDVTGDGTPEVIFGGGGAYNYANPDPAKPTGKWIVHAFSQGVTPNPHGLGVGDMNKDGRVDILAPAGWWEGPAKGTPPGPWTFHPASFGGGGAEMCAYDVNGDGLTDVVTALAAHRWGLSWFEQKKDATFEEHAIMGDFSTKNAGGVTFSELHGSGCADLNGDRIPDFITGKRYWSHLENFSGPDLYGAPVLYVYKTVRNPKAPGGAEFVPELIHNRSGIGSTIVVSDLNKDAALDIVTSTNLGTFIFWGNKGQVPVPR